jgi:hypothetical protein
VGGAITFPLTVTGTTAGAQSLTLTTTGAISFGGNVGATRLGDISITAGAGDLTIGPAATSIQGNSFIVNGTRSTKLQNSGILSIDASGSAGGSIAFGGTVQGFMALSQPLTLRANGTGSVTFSGNVGTALVPLGNLIIRSGSGTFILDTGVTNLYAGSLTVGDSTVLPTLLKNTGALTIQTSSAPGNIVFNGSVTGTTAGVQALTLNPGAASISVTGVVGATRLGDLTITSVLNAAFASSITAGSLVQTAGTGTSIFSGGIDVNTATGVVLSGRNFTFSGAVSASSGGAAITNTGLLTIQSSAPFSIQGAFSQTGGGSSSVGANILTNNNMSGSISFQNPVAVTSNCTFNTDPSPITFFSTVEGPASLTLVGSTVTFYNTVGAGTVLTGLDVTGSSIAVYGNHTTSGAMSYTGPVVLNADMNFQNTGSGGITFSSTITGNYELMITGLNTFIDIGGNVSTASLASTNGRPLTATGGSHITFSGSISTQGGTPTGVLGPAGGDILIQSTGGSVSVAEINTSGTNDVVVGGNAGDLLLQPASGLSATSFGNLPDGQLILNGDLIALGGTGAVSGMGGDIRLSVIGRSLYPSIATITSSFSGNSVSISGRSFTMGTNEAMTLFGSLTVNLTGAATVSDIVARDGLTITSPGGLTLVGHGLVQILNSAGELYYIYGGHLLARTAISATVTSYVGPFDTVSLVDISDQTLFQAALTYAPNSYMLNYGFVQPAPPVPPIVVPTFPISRASFINQMGVASISFEDLLPMLIRWGVWSYPYRGHICPANPDEPCWPIPHLFDPFLLENKVVDR